jgi:hypothetical protein
MSPWWLLSLNLFFCTKISNVIIFSSFMRATCRTHPILFDMTVPTIPSDECKCLQPAQHTRIQHRHVSDHPRRTPLNSWHSEMATPERPVIPPSNLDSPERAAAIKMTPNRIVTIMDVSEDATGSSSPWFLLFLDSASSLNVETVPFSETSANLYIIHGDISQ